MITDINCEDRLVQKTFADHLHDVLGWESIYAFNDEVLGPTGTLGRASERETILVRDLRAALKRLNPDLPESAREQAVEKLARVDFARSLIQHNREYYDFIRNGVPVEWRDTGGETKYARALVLERGHERGQTRKGSNHRLELELSAWWFVMVMHPLVQQGAGALGRAHLQACCDPLQRQGGLFSEARGNRELALVVL